MTREDDGPGWERDTIHKIAAYMLTPELRAEVEALLADRDDLRRQLTQARREGAADTLEWLRGWDDARDKDEELKNAAELVRSGELEVPVSTREEDAEVCTIRAQLAGITLDPCGQPVTHTSTGHCERGHTRSRALCTSHAEAFPTHPGLIFCEQCDREGVETPMTVTVGLGKST